MVGVMVLFLGSLSPSLCLGLVALLWAQRASLHHQQGSYLPTL